MTCRPASGDTSLPGPCCRHPQTLCPRGLILLQPGQMGESPPLSPVAKSAQSPLSRLIRNDPGERSARVGFSATQSRPIRARLWRNFPQDGDNICLCCDLISFLSDQEICLNGIGFDFLLYLPPCASLCGSHAELRSVPDRSKTPRQTGVQIF